MPNKKKGGNGPAKTKTQKQTAPKVSEPKEKTQKSVNHYLVEVGDLDEWVLAFAACFVALFVAKSSVGSCQDDSSRHTTFKNADDLNDAHVVVFRRWIYEMNNKTSLSIDIPVPFYMELVFLVSMRFVQDNYVIEFLYDLPESWATTPNAEQRNLFSKGGTYAVTFGWRCLNGLSYLTSDGYYPVQYTVPYGGDGSKISRKTSYPMQVGANRFVQIEGVTGFIGQSLEGQSLAKRLSMAHTARLPKIKVSEDDGVNPLKILSCVQNPELPEESIYVRACRSVDAITQAGLQDHLLGIGAHLPQSFNQEMCADAVTAWVLALTTTSVGGLPGRIVSPLGRMGVALHLVASYACSQPHHLCTILFAINKNVDFSADFIKMIKTLIARKPYEMTLPATVSDSFMANRTHYFPRRSGSTNYFVAATPFLNWGSHVPTTDPTTQTHLTSIDKVVTELTYLQRGKVRTKSLANNYEDYTKVMLSAASHNTSCCQSMAPMLVSGPVVSRDLHRLNLSSRLILVRYSPNSARQTNQLQFDIDEDDLSQRGATSITDDQLDAVIARMATSIHGGFGSTDSPIVEGLCLFTEAVGPDGAVDADKMRVIINNILQGCPARDRQRGIVYSHIDKDSVSSDLNKLAQILRFPIAVADSVTPDDLLSTDRDSSNLLAVGYGKIGELDDTRHRAAMACLVNPYGSGASKEFYSQLLGQVAKVGVFGAIISGLGRFALGVGKTFVKSGGIDFLAQGLTGLAGQLLG